MVLSQHLPYDDPRENLPPRALNLLEAARRLLIRKGYDGLTWSQIAEEAGESKSTIAYYFKDKNSLVLALLRLMGQAAAQRLAEQCESLPPGTHRLHAFLLGLRSLHQHPESLAFYDVLPHALRDQRMREQVAALYDWYKELNLRVLSLDGASEATGSAWHEQSDVSPERSEQTLSRNDTLEGIAWLLMAAVDGILIQEALKPTDYDSNLVHDQLEKSLVHLLEVEAEG